MKLSPKIKVSGLFFDSKLLIGKVDKSKIKALSKFGSFVRQTSRKSIRKAGPKTQAKPGGPPKSRVGTLKRLIYFSYDPKTESVVIGPALLANKSTSNPPTAALEHGGISDNGLRYRQFPFMKPAFDKELPKARLQFANIIK